MRYDKEMILKNISFVIKKGEKVTIAGYSNAISKIWNSEVFLSGSKAEKQDAVDCVKQLCCQNNFVIDFAKTLYKPEFPKEVSDRIARYTGGRLPAFFEFAKDKEKSH